MTVKPDERGPKSASYQQIALAMLSHTGIAEVRAIRPEPSKHSMARAVLYLRGQKHDVRAEELARYVKHHWPVRKSKTRPHTGDVRLYKVLEQDNIRYARIPVEVLGAKKGDSIQTVFEEDKITLRHMKLDDQLKHVEARNAKKKPKRT